MGLIRNIIVLLMLASIIWFSVAFINTPADDLKSKFLDFYHSQSAFIQSKLMALKKAYSKKAVENIQKEIEAIEHPKTRIKSRIDLIKDLSYSIEKIESEDAQNGSEENSKTSQNNSELQSKNQANTENKGLTHASSTQTNLGGSEIKKDKEEKIKEARSLLSELIEKTFKDLNENYQELDPVSKDELISELAKEYVKDNMQLDINSLFSNPELLSSFYLNLAMESEELDPDLLNKISDKSLKELYLFLLNIKNKDSNTKSWLFDLKLKIQDLESLLLEKRFVQAKAKLDEIRQFILEHANN